MREKGLESLQNRATGASHGFAAEAEGLRREGNAQAALQAARAGLRSQPDDLPGRVAAALALIDLGRSDEARAELEAFWERPATALAEPVAEEIVPEAAVVDAAGEGLDAELDRALAEARPEREAMLDADSVALRAMREADLDEPEPDEGSSPFRTETMANLLERQGDVEGARAIRTSLGQVAVPQQARTSDPALATLERWLGNLKRGRA